MGGNNGGAVATREKKAEHPNSEQGLMRIEHLNYLKKQGLPPETIRKEMKSLPHTILRGAPS